MTQRKHAWPPCAGSGVVARDVLSGKEENEVWKWWVLRIGENTKGCICFLILSLRNLSCGRLRSLSRTKTRTQNQVGLWPPELSSGLCWLSSCSVANCSAAFASWDKLNTNSILIHASFNRFNFIQTINYQTQTPLSFLAVSLCSLFLTIKSLKSQGFSMPESIVPLGHDTVGLEIGLQITWEQQDEF